MFLPNLEADISTATQEMFHTLGHHADSLLLLNISPRIVNGSSIVPLEKISITIYLDLSKYMIKFVKCANEEYFNEKNKKLKLVYVFIQGQNKFQAVRPSN